MKGDPGGAYDVRGALNLKVLIWTGVGTKKMCHTSHKQSHLPLKGKGNKAASPTSAGPQSRPFSLSVSVDLFSLPTNSGKINLIKTYRHSYPNLSLNEY